MSDAEQQLREFLREAAPQPGQLDFDGVVRRVALRRRSRTIGAAGAVAALSAAAIIVPLALVGGRSPGASTVAAHTVIRGEPLRSTIILAADNQETFAPPPSYLHATLTAQQAFDEFAKNDKPIPSNISYQLGILTSPPAITDVLAWGFHGQGGCINIGGNDQLVRPRPVAPGPAAVPSPPPQCVEWTFISATTGHFVEGTGQEIGLPTPAQSPTPDSVIALQSGGLLDTEAQQFSPQDLVLQGPLSTIRWTFDNSTCTIALHWFLPPATLSSPQHPPCPWTHTFTTSLTTDFASRGHVFTVVAGYVPEREHYSVKATLADGDTRIYDASDADGAWMFAAQRCGNIAGTAIRSVTLLRYRHGFPHALPTPERIVQTNPTAIEKDCQSN